MFKRRTDIDDDQVIAYIEENECTYDEAATHFDCSLATVSSIMRGMRCTSKYLDQQVALRGECSVPDCKRPVGIELHKLCTVCFKGKKNDVTEEHRVSHRNPS